MNDNSQELNQVSHLQDITEQLFLTPSNQQLDGQFTVIDESIEGAACNGMCDSGSCRAG